MVKVKLPTFRPKPESTSPAESLSEGFNNVNNNNTNNCSNTSTNSSNGGSKLWDNDELVMQALRVYGKHPRPQCFNEISRVCKLSNLRKSRYFHEKMMKNNPYEAKIRKLIAEEGESEYPFFKIFFEEYKTKKERQKLMSYEEDKHSMMSNENSELFLDNNSEDAGAYDTRASLRNDTYEGDFNNNNDNEDAANEDTFLDDCGSSVVGQTVAEPELYYNQNISPLISTNSQYLENLELKLKILNKEKETMIDYFQTFSNVIDNLKTEISCVKEVENGRANQGNSELMNGHHDYTLNKDDLNGASLQNLQDKLNDTKQILEKLKSSVTVFEREQAHLKEDLKLTTNYAHVENRKLQDELNAYRAKLSVRDEQVSDLKRRLNEALHENRVTTAKSIQAQTNACLTRSKFNELKENFDRLFSQIQSLS